MQACISGHELLKTLLCRVYRMTLKTAALVSTTRVVHTAGIVDKRGTPRDRILGHTLSEETVKASSLIAFTPEPLVAILGTQPCLTMR